VTPDADKAVEETLAEVVSGDPGSAAAPIPTPVAMAVASPDMGLTGDAITDDASAAGVIAGAPAPAPATAADVAVEAGAVQSGATPPANPATVPTGQGPGAAASALSIAATGADGIHAATKPAVAASANPALTGDSPTQSSTTPASSAALPSPQTDAGTAGQGSADGKARDGEDRTGTGPDGAQKSADGQAPRLAAPKPDMPKPDFLQRLEQTLAGLEGRAGHRLSEPAPAHAGEQRPGAEMARPTHPSAVPMEIGLRALQGAKEFQIRLDPAELGRIDVRLEIGDDKSVSARLVVDRVETLQLLQRDAKTLERALEQAGLKANDAGIDISLRDPGQQGRPDRGQREDDIPGPFGRNRDGRPESIEAPPVLPRARSLRAGGLDLSI
jgi:flagellar hook-length control protein FliK